MDEGDIVGELSGEIGHHSPIRLFQAGVRVDAHTQFASPLPIACDSLEIASSQLAGPKGEGGHVGIDLPVAFGPVVSGLDEHRSQPRIGVGLEGGLGIAIVDLDIGPVDHGGDARL